jgi:hypothetical protein
MSPCRILSQLAYLRQHAQRAQALSELQGLAGSCTYRHSGKAGDGGCVCSRGMCHQGWSRTYRM